MDGRACGSVGGLVCVSPGGLVDRRRRAAWRTGMHAGGVRAAWVVVWRISRCEVIVCVARHGTLIDPESCGVCCVCPGHRGLR